MNDPITFLKKQSAHYQRTIGDNKLSELLNEMIAQLHGRPIDGFRLLSINALIGMLERLSTDSGEWDIAERVASLCAIPAERISEYDRLRYIERTIADEDVYAYWKPGRDDAGVWNLYDVDTRIALCVLPGTWQIEQETPVEDHTSALTLRHRDDDRRVLVYVNVAPPFNKATDYTPYRQRKIAELLGHINTFGLTPEPGDIYHY